MDPEELNSLNDESIKLFCTEEDWSWSDEDLDLDLEDLLEE
jgi:hypothetical protein